MPTVLITGANRGIGLGFARSYAGDRWRVFATCRDPKAATDLRALADGSKGAVTVHRLDVTSAADVSALAREVGGEQIDVLLNNAGKAEPQRRSGAMDYDAWATTMAVNAMAPVRMAEAFGSNVARSERRVMAAITSGMSSIGDNTSGGYIAYRSSKAALNMAMKSLSVDLRARGIVCVVLNPGWVRTRMGGEGGGISVPDAVARMRKILDGLQAADTGKFFNHDGKEFPW